MIKKLNPRYSYLFELLNLLSKNDRKKIIYLGILQFLISIFDLFGLLLIGIVTSLSVNIISLAPIPKSLNFIFGLPLIGDLELETLVISLSLIGASFLIFKTVASALITRKLAGFLSLREAQISSQYISYISNTSPKWQLNKSPQYISGVAIEGVNSAITLTLGQCVNLIVEFFSVSVIFLGVSSFDPTITLPSLLFFTVSGWMSVKFLTSRTKEAGKEQFLAGISSNEMVKNIVITSRDLYLANKRIIATDHYSELRLKNYRAVRTKAIISLIPKYISEVTMLVGGILIAGYQFMIKDARDAITALVVFLALSSRILPSLLRIQGDLLQIRGSSEATKNFLEEFKIAANLAPDNTKLKFFESHLSLVAEKFEPSIRLSNVSLRHSETSDFSISDLSLEVNPGEFVAITGPSGSGKTTLVDLMLGILDPDSGSAQISGLRPAMAVKKWPNAIRYVPQDVQLIPGSILQNITWPELTSDLGEEELRNLFETVELMDWIDSLDEGWHSVINSLGTNLSGGQKQRIGIARALYSSPKILFLDESTSSLDVKTEEEIVSNILLKMKNITRIVIAHRISTIKDADRIINIENGKIASIENV